jgi:hypothetical protein
MSKVEPVSLFRIGLATPLSTVVQIILCMIALVYFGKRRNVPKEIKDKSIKDSGVLKLWQEFWKLRWIL